MLIEASQNFLEAGLSDSEGGLAPLIDRVSKLDGLGQVEIQAILNIRPRRAVALTTVLAIGSSVINHLFF